MKLIDVLKAIRTNGTVVVKVTTKEHWHEFCAQREEELYTFLTDEELDSEVWMINPLGKNYIEIKTI